MFIQEKAFENDIWKMSAILSRPQCVNTSDIPEVTLTEELAIFSYFLLRKLTQPLHIYHCCKLSEFPCVILLQNRQ